MISASQCQAAPTRVGVWWFALDGDAAAPLAPHLALLAPDELARAARYRFERDRRRYVAGRAQLRTLLAHHVGCTATQLQFDYNPNGKPRLAACHGAAALHFNLSHSGSYAACALSHGARVGIDLEADSSALHMAPLAAAVLSAPEHAQLAPAFDDGALLQIWTRKEALLKAWGVGLSIPMTSFAVWGPQGAHGSVELDDGQGTLQAWSLRAATVPPGYTGALAIEGNSAEVQFNGCWRGAGPPA